MKKTVFNTLIYSVFLLFGITAPIIAREPEKERAREQLRQILKERPEIAEKFLKEVAKRNGSKPTPAKPITPKPAPAQPPKREVKEEPAPQPAPAVPQPTAEKAWMTDSELSDLNTIFTILESNTMRIIECLNAFFCKTNCQPYQTHVTCLKSQVAYLQENLISKFPRAETPERQAIFQGFYEITKTLEQGEITILKIIDPKPSGILDFKGRYEAIDSMLGTFQKKVNQIANKLKGELRADLRPRMNKLQTNINRMFNFSQTLPKNPLTLINIIQHRLGT